MREVLLFAHDLVIIADIIHDFAFANSTRVQPADIRAGGGVVLTILCDFIGRKSGIWHGATNASMGALEEDWDSYKVGLFCCRLTHPAHKPDGPV